jgi:hypothetical protein
MEKAIVGNHYADVPVSLRQVRKKFERSETISEQGTPKAKCPKCGGTKVSQIPGNVFVVTSKKS